MATHFVARFTGFVHNYVEAPLPALQWPWVKHSAPFRENLLWMDMTPAPPPPPPSKKKKNARNSHMFDMTPLPSPQELVHPHMSFWAGAAPPHPREGPFGPGILEELSVVHSRQVRVRLEVEDGTLHLSPPKRMRPLFFTLAVFVFVKGSNGTCVCVFFGGEQPRGHIV